MKAISDFIIPFVVFAIVLFGALKGVDTFNEFLKGVKEGFKIVLGIAPSLIALIFGINLLKCSGALEIIAELLSPIACFLGIPKELIPLTVLTPVSGSGSVAMLENILKEFSPDSFIGICSSIIMSSTETTFYTMTVYYNSVGIKKTRHTLPSALCADLTSFILSPKIVRWFFQ